MDYSIIVPIHNQEKYILRCLSSLKKLELDNIEFILIDNGSTDQTAKICKSFIKDDGRFKYYYQENKLVSGARNAGLDKSTGDYITFVDSDDEITKEYKLLLQKAKNENLDMLVFSFLKDIEMDGKLTKEKPTFVSDKEMEILSFQDNSSEIFATHFLRKRFVNYSWNKVYKKEIFDTYNIRFSRDILYYEDKLLNYTFLPFVRKIGYTNITGYVYHLNSNSNSYSIPQIQNNFVDAYKVYEICKAFFEKYNYNELFDMFPILAIRLMQSAFAINRQAGADVDKIIAGYHTVRADVCKITTPDIFIKSLKMYKRYCELDFIEESKILMFWYSLFEDKDISNWQKMYGNFDNLL